VSQFPIESPTSHDPRLNLTYQDLPLAPALRSPTLFTPHLGCHLQRLWLIMKVAHLDPTLHRWEPNFTPERINSHWTLANLGEVTGRARSLDMIACEDVRVDTSDKLSLTAPMRNARGEQVDPNSTSKITTVTAMLDCCYLGPRINYSIYRTWTLGLADGS
jgi:hypothetical protein